MCDKTQPSGMIQAGENTGQQAPDLEWLENDVPRAQHFDDTYFSKAGGLAETRYVFLGGNGLPERWSGRQQFTIAEFGFGTGLNFLTTLDAYRQSGATGHLTFLSFELFPMTKEQLQRALSTFPELQDGAQELLLSWAPEPGWNILQFENIALVLGVGDARELINQIRVDENALLPKADIGQVTIPPVDAWYLDGFSPSKNPQLWEGGLLATARQLTANDGSLATYTAAGWVRRNLQAAGFDVTKTKGFAGKREMVTGSNRAEEFNSNE